MIQNRAKPICKNCNEPFHPDYRNRERQKYCDKPECRKASKANSQKRWLNKPENQNYFRGSNNVDRVREWRKNNPGYSKKNSSASKTLQDSCDQNSKLKQDIKPQQPSEISGALQDFCTPQLPVLIGLISQLSGQVLQDDIAKTTQLLEQLGTDILNSSYENKGGINYDFKTSCASSSDKKDTGTIQLGGSSPGP
jgi:hypothetical protein